jgi:chromosome segregation ATPase
LEAASTAATAAAAREATNLTLERTKAVELESTVCILEQQVRRLQATINTVQADDQARRCSVEDLQQTNAFLRSEISRIDDEREDLEEEAETQKAKALEAEKHASKLERCMRLLAEGQLRTDLRSRTAEDGQKALRAQYAKLETIARESEQRKAELAKAVTRLTGDLAKAETLAESRAKRAERMEAEIDEQIAYMIELEPCERP